MAMSATPGPEKKKAKRSYAKPAMKRVHLKPEEAVLGACKSSTQYGPVTSGCGASGVPCSAIGS
jgi:hypothetical protein